VTGYVLKGWLELIMGNNNIIVLLGKSGAGKDKIARYMCDNFGYNFIISATTRPMRDYESQENPYHFINYNDFLELIDFNSLIEYRTYDTKFGSWFYGVRKSDVEEDKPYVVVLDVKGFSDFKNYFGDRVESIYVDVDADTRKLRSLKRGSHDEEEWERRRIDDDIVFKNVENLVNLTVENYSFKECIENILHKISKVCVEDLEA